MTQGTPHEQTTINLNDSAELRAYMYDQRDQPVPESDLTSVEFTVKAPDQTETTTAGVIDTDGAGFLRFLDTSQTGLYIWVARFTFSSGEVRSYRDEFNVVNPLEVAPQTQRNKIASEVWMRIEDCFDSELGGPWLRDQTLAYFDPSKVERFVSEGLIFINGWPPITNFGLDMFTTPIPDHDPNLPDGSMQDDPDQIVIIQATLLAVIKHLMRSYVEQPNVVGANMVWQDRRDYLQRWQTIYTIEEGYFRQVVALWKRQFYNFGHSSLLVSSKAGRLGYGPGFRARNAARGY